MNDMSKYHWKIPYQISPLSYMYNLNVGKIENSAKIIADAAIMHKLISIRQTTVDYKPWSGAWYSPIILRDQQPVIYEKYHWQYPWSEGSK